MEPVYSGHPWDTTSWLLYRGGLLYIVVTLETQPVGCYTEVVCLYSGTCSGHPWDITSWLLYRGGLFIQWNLYIVVILGTQPVGCYTEVVCENVSSKFCEFYFREKFFVAIETTQQKIISNIL